MSRETITTLMLLITILIFMTSTFFAMRSNDMLAEELREILKEDISRMYRNRVLEDRVAVYQKINNSLRKENEELKEKLNENRN